MKKIEPDIDRYGNLARASFFADYIEILTIKGHRSRKQLLRDLIEDNFRLRREVLAIPEDSDLEEWSPGEYAENAWTCLQQRAEILGDSYPFRVTSNRLSIAPGFDVRSSSYVGLLAVSLAHAFKEDESLEVEYVFEDMVADAMESIGLSVGRLGSISRELRAGFEPSMVELGNKMDLPTYPNSIVRRASANDAGVDVIGHLDWKDKRKGRWIYIGQVTCAKTDMWRAKIYEPVPDDWRMLLGENIPPVPFLAVPIHVEDDTVSHMSGIGRSIVDRPQLTLNLTAIRPEVLAIIEEVLGADIQTFAVQ